MKRTARAPAPRPVRHTVALPPTPDAHGGPAGRSITDRSHARTRRDLARRGTPMSIRPQQIPSRTIVPPSAEVRAEALADARRLAEGLFPHQVEGVAFLL